MTHNAVSLRIGRVRLVVAAMLCTMIATIGIVWPAPRHGVVLYATAESAVTLAAAFTRETGIAVTVVRLSTGPMLARIATEGHRPGWTMAWVDGDMAAASLDRAGLLQRGLIADVPWTALGRSLLPADGAWVPTGVSLAGVRLSRRGAAGAVGMPDPAISGAAYPELAGLIWHDGGWPAGKQAVVALHAAGLSVAPTSAAVIAELDAGRLGGALIQSSTAYAAARNDRSIVPDVPRPAFLLPGVLMVASGTPPTRRSEADRFIAFVLSARAQRLHLESGAADSFYWPLTEGAAAPPPLPPLATLSVVHLDPYRWSALQAEITAWFETLVAQP